MVSSKGGHRTVLSKYATDSVYTLRRHLKSFYFSLFNTASAFSVIVVNAL